ncbi:MAG: 5-formyltetrahydrofolate cyclo-ligase [Candidatus Omnitrophica bacterium]|nr:5-formyltetrahydrofolate cyclo-ligase [Candidatus Omnitrophota bacterium]
MEMVENHSKQQLRKQMLAKLVALTKNELKRRSKNVETKLSSLSLYKNSEIIMFYYPIEGEVNIKEIIRKACLEKKVCLPVTDLLNKTLRIFEIDDLDCGLAKGAFGIKEPNKKKAKELDINEIDTVIVPGLAYDYNRNRLGRGGGFYDRLLKKLPNSVQKLGVAFDFQILKSLPTNLFTDQKVDLIVTENRTI